MKMKNFETDPKSRSAFVQRLYEERLLREQKASIKETPKEEPKTKDNVKKALSDKEVVDICNYIDANIGDTSEKLQKKRDLLNSCETEILSEEVLRYVINEDHYPEDPQYGIPEEKKYPLFDKKHVESAIRLFGHVSEKYEEQLAHAIIAKMKEFNIPISMVGEENRLYKYLLRSNLTESILDPLHDERCRDIFEDDNTIKEEVVDFILKTYYDWESTLAKKPVLKSLYAVGSIFGYLYSSDTDIDVHATLDCTDEELDEIKKSRPADVNLPGTSHPVEITLKNKEERLQSNESMYDLLNRKFVKLVDKKKIGEVPTEYISRISKFFMDSLDLNMGSANRHLEDLNIIETRYRNKDIDEDDYFDAVMKIKDELIVDNDALAFAFKMIRGFRADTMNRGERPFDISIKILDMPDDPHYQTNEMIYKTFAKYGYRERLVEIQKKLAKTIDRLNNLNKDKI